MVGKIHNLDINGKPKGTEYVYNTLNAGKIMQQKHLGLIDLVLISGPLPINKWLIDFMRISGSRDT
jgi:hypothetical protein